MALAGDFRPGQTIGLGRKVDLRCVQEGGSYRPLQTIDGQSGIELRWNLWAHLDDGTWLPMKAVAETTGVEDPAALQLPGC